MRAGRLWSLTLAFSILATAWAQSASADEAAALFDPGRMFVIKLSLPEKSRQELAKDHDKYQPGTFSLAETDGTPGGVGPFSTLVNVKIKLKGSASLRPLEEKSAFKIKFEEQPFRGLRYLTLNNMVEDRSMLHETLAYTAFRGAGVPASRTGYAYVYVDGDDYGLHLNIEALDQPALEKRFGSFDADTQHLYEGEGGDEVRPGWADGYEIDEGGADLDDLEALIEAVNSSGSSSWASRVAAAADLQEMTRMWATEKYIGQWDGYAGRDGETWLPNNYYLYSDPDGVFQMLPWGNDESWQMAYRLPFDGPAGLMFNRCLEDEACAAVYRQSVAAVRTAIVGMGIDSLAVKTAALLAPWQAMEQANSTREEHSIESIQDGVGETREFIASRPGDVAEWLGEAAEPEAGPADPGARSVDPTSASAPAPHRLINFSNPGLRVGRVWVGKGVIRAQAHPWGRGVVTQRVTVSMGKGPVVACRDRVRVERAGDLTLSCRLPAPVRERLQRRGLGLVVHIRFLPAGGRPESATRRIALPHG
jgi:hypothetical protein